MFEFHKFIAMKPPELFPVKIFSEIDDLQILGEREEVIFH